MRPNEHRPDPDELSDEELDSVSGGTGTLVMPSWNNGDPQPPDWSRPSFDLYPANTPDPPKRLRHP